MVCLVVVLYAFAAASEVAGLIRATQEIRKARNKWEQIKVRPHPGRGYRLDPLVVEALDAILAGGRASVWLLGVGVVLGVLASLIAVVFLD